jgi:hypothetical protein
MSSKITKKADNHKEAAKKLEGPICAYCKKELKKKDIIVEFQVGKSIKKDIIVHTKCEDL